MDYNLIKKYTSNYQIEIAYRTRSTLLCMGFLFIRSAFGCRDFDLAPFGSGTKPIKQNIKVSRS